MSNPFNRLMRSLDERPQDEARPARAPHDQRPARPGSSDHRARLAGMAAAAALTQACANFRGFTPIDGTPDYAAAHRADHPAAARTNEVSRGHAEVLDQWGRWSAIDERTIRSFADGIDQAPTAPEVRAHVSADVRMLAASVSDARGAMERAAASRQGSAATESRLDEVVASSRRLRDLPRAEARLMTSSVERALGSMEASPLQARVFLRNVLAENPDHYAPGLTVADNEQVRLAGMTRNECELLANFLQAGTQTGDYPTSETEIESIRQNAELSHSQMRRLYTNFVRKGSFSQRTWQRLLDQSANQDLEAIRRLAMGLEARLPGVLLRFYDTHPTAQSEHPADGLDEIGAAYGRPATRAMGGYTMPTTADTARRADRHHGGSHGHHHRPHHGH